MLVVRSLFFYFSGAALLASISVLAPAVRAEHSHLKEIIITINEEAIKDSLKDGTYRGEAGLLRLKPESGKSLGLKVLMHREYLDS